ncbi:hypothetical protein NX059_012113 [Plenodomus lindquistii]|nr:hypothetical protein NX059_012113 [Plenodomus lindquistii]
MDWCGFLFSLLALVTQRKFDLLVGITAAVCCAIELGILGSHAIWMIRTRKLRQQARLSGQSLDASQDYIIWESQGVDYGKKLARLWIQLIDPVRPAVPAVAATPTT